MDISQLIVLALVQGITEFLPISSSGHLILIPLLTPWPDQGVILDVAVHVGTLGAVVLYLWRDLLNITRGFFLGSRPTDSAVNYRQLALQIVVATIPVIVIGIVIKEALSTDLRTLPVIAWAMLGFGIILWLADRYAPAVRGLDTIGYRDALLIGLAQALALIPGTSRAGITITAARMLGYQRTEAARFSMLLSIPTIVAAGAIATLEILESGNWQLGHDALIGAALAFASALIAIILMMRWLKTATFTPFVIYRIILGVILLAIAYG